MDLLVNFFLISDIFLHFFLFISLYLSCKSFDCWEKVILLNIWDKILKFTIRIFLFVVFGKLKSCPLVFCGTHLTLSAGPPSGDTGGTMQLGPKRRKSMIHG
ncbi:hypothetical protein XENTR_v10017918 [Xenopus tropicalis]|nr:hypothetical protein XENTR_v10017918 [Xenopus tropicalis]